MNAIARGRPGKALKSHLFSLCSHFITVPPETHKSPRIINQVSRWHLMYVALNLCYYRVHFMWHFLSMVYPVTPTDVLNKQILKVFLKWWPKKSLTVKVSDSQSRDSGVEANWVPPIAPSLWIKVPMMEKVYACCMGLECVGGASTPQTQILSFTVALKDRHAQNSDCISVLHFCEVLNLLKVSCLFILINFHHSVSQQLVHPN